MKCGGPTAATSTRTQDSTHVPHQDCIYLIKNTMKYYYNLKCLLPILIHVTKSQSLLINVMCPRFK